MQPERSWRLTSGELGWYEGTDRLWGQKTLGAGDSSIGKEKGACAVMPEKNRAALGGLHTVPVRIKKTGLRVPVWLSG